MQMVKRGSVIVVAQAVALEFFGLNTQLPQHPAHFFLSWVVTLHLLFWCCNLAAYRDVLPNPPLHLGGSQKIVPMNAITGNIFDSKRVTLLRQKPLQMHACSCVGAVVLRKVFAILFSHPADRFRVWDVYSSDQLIIDTWGNIFVRGRGLLAFKRRRIMSAVGGDMRHRGQ
ncbi:hypothetical protein C8R45DRAFT_975739 [Mycena sanguinolenta]|nr:hypothetical protein C8R45DRAFT_975739 [Mycena sanguinolenta]